MFLSWFEFALCKKADVGVDNEDKGIDVQPGDNDARPVRVPRIEAVATLNKDVVDMFEKGTGFEREYTTFSVRTACDDSVPAEQALQKLQDGNKRFLDGLSCRSGFVRENSEALVAHGQNPYAVVIGCADSRCPVEIMFDAEPGDLFVLRNAGNTLTHAEASIVGSVEYSVGNLQTNLVIVVGHTNCGAIAGATKTALAGVGTEQNESTLNTLLAGLGPVALQAQAELQAEAEGPSKASVEEIAARAVRVNVFRTIEKLLTYSEPLRAKARSGTLQLHGAVFDIATGQVEFLGPSPRQSLLMDSESVLLPRVVFSGDEHPAVGGA